MNIFFAIMIIILTVSNVLLWICLEGLSIVFKKLCEQYIELGECMSEGSDEE